jgi:hypothetical protein
MVQGEAFHSHQPEHQLGRGFCSRQHNQVETAVTSQYLYVQFSEAKSAYHELDSYRERLLQRIVQFSSSVRDGVGLLFRNEVYGICICLYNLLTM